MKKTHELLLVVLPVIGIIACNSLDFKRTKSGVLYKIISSGNSNDSIIKPGEVLKFHFISKLNDSVLYSNYDKMPEFFTLRSGGDSSYSPEAVISKLRKGDSAIIVILADSLINKRLGYQLPPGTKMGDRLTTIIKVIDIFKNDSTARMDYEAEQKKDEPRRTKELAEQAAKEEQLGKEAFEKELAEIKASGEMEKEFKAMEEYLAAKKITTQKTGMGVYVVIEKQGNGPKVDSGKTITVKYTGKILATDSTFESSSYTFEIGKGRVIQGWEQGLMLFNQGGKGTLYIPGFLAYGKNPGPGSPFKAYEALKFDVELLDVKDTPATTNGQQ